MASSSFIASLTLSRQSSGVFPKIRLLFTIAKGTERHSPQNERHSLIITATSGNSSSILSSISNEVNRFASHTSTTINFTLPLSFYLTLLNISSLTYPKKHLKICAFLMNYFAEDKFG